MISFHFGDHRVVLRSVFLNWASVFNFVAWAQFQVLILSFLFGTGIGTGLYPFCTQTCMPTVGFSFTVC